MTLNGTSRISLTQAYVLSQDEKELLENCSRLCYNFVDTTDDLTSSFVPSNSHQDFGSLGKEIISQSASSTNGIILLLIVFNESKSSEIGKEMLRKIDHPKSKLSLEYNIPNSLIIDDDDPLKDTIKKDDILMSPLPPDSEKPDSLRNTPTPRMRRISSSSSTASSEYYTPQSENIERKNPSPILETKNAKRSSPYLKPLKPQSASPPLHNRSPKQLNFQSPPVHPNLYSKGLSPSSPSQNNYYTQNKPIVPNKLQSALLSPINNFNRKKSPSFERLELDSKQIKYDSPEQHPRALNLQKNIRNLSNLPYVKKIMTKTVEKKNSPTTQEDLLSINGFPLLGTHFDEKDIVDEGNERIFTKPDNEVKNVLLRSKSLRNKKTNKCKILRPHSAPINDNSKTNEIRIEAREIVSRR